MELSRKDCRLLFELDQDSRQSNLSLARKLRISKNTVASRIEWFRAAGVIKNFYAVVDVARLGYRGMRVYLKLRQCPPRKRGKIIGCLVESPILWWVGSIEGDYDIGVVAWIRDIAEFERFWKGFEKTFHKYLASTCISPYVGLYDCTFGFLNQSSERKITHIGSMGAYSKSGIAKNELEVLRHLSDNARATTVSIAEKLRLSPLTVKQCIRRLREKGVIKGFRVRLDLLALGYTQYKVNFRLFDSKPREKMLSYALSCPNTIFIDETLGFADLEVTVEFKTHIEFRKFLDGFLKRFSKNISDFDYFVYLGVHKIKHQV